MTHFPSTKKPMKERNASFDCAMPSRPLKFSTRCLFSKGRLKGIFTILFAAAATLSFAQDEPQQHIDISSLPAKVVSDVVVPVPTEVFGVLDKLGSPNWREILRPVKSEAFGDRPRVALELGSVIAEGFIAVEAQDPEEVKRIGRAVLNLAGAIGVRKSVIARTSSIIEAADKKNWQRVRIELDGASQDVKQAMIELKDEQLAQLVSLGGWLRGTEALTQVVSKNYTVDGAELLHQPALLDYFIAKIGGMDSRLKSDPLVKNIRDELNAIHPLISEPGNISAQNVDKIHSITSELVKSISTQAS